MTTISSPLLPERLEVPAMVAREIDSREYGRLLEWPRERPFTPEVEERAEASRRWYEEHGEPVAHLRLFPIEDCTEESVTVESPAGPVTLRAPSLAERLRRAQAPSLVLVAVTAGAAVDREVALHWRRSEVDEAYFLDRFAACVAEHLIGRVRVELCQRFEPAGFAVLRNLGPGHRGWPTEELARTVRLLAAPDGTLPPPLSVLDSGMMLPKCSAITAFGLAPARDGVEHSPDDVPCEVCDLRACRFRRRPFRARNA